MSDAEFLIRWWATFKGPPAAILDRPTMVGLLLAARSGDRTDESAKEVEPMRRRG